MIILIFKDFNGLYLTVRNPSQVLIDNAENLYIDAIMKVYDFQSGEIVTFYNEDFSWHELTTVINTRLTNFKDTRK